MRMKHGIRLALVAALATAGLVSLSSGPASALCAQPAPPAADGRIRELPAGAFIGNNVYSVFGQGQSVQLDLDPGQKASFEVKYKNRSDKSRGIFVVGRVSTGDFDSFRIRAFLGDTEVTSAVGGMNGLKLPGIQPGHSTPGVVITIKMKNSAGANDSLELLAHGSYKNYDRLCGDGLGMFIEEPV